MSFEYNPQNYMYAKMSRKSRQNKVGVDHPSATLLENAIGQDSVNAYKLGFKFSKLGMPVPRNSNLVAKASTELVRGSSTNLWKSKFFTRVVRQIEGRDVYAHASLSGGIIHNLGLTPLKVNDAFYLQNFKGIKNIGYYYDPGNKKKQLGGEILGFDRYLNLHLKLLQENCPMLAAMNIEPFIFCNMALAPNRNKEQQTGSWLARHLRWSTGIGLSMQLRGVAIECYYNIYVSKQKHELRSDFQISIGLD